MKFFLIFDFPRQLLLEIPNATLPIFFIANLVAVNIAIY